MSGVEVTTEPFAERPGAYTRHEMARVCARWWWVLAIPVIACAFAGAIYDAVWYFVMLILIFTLYPAVVAFVWMYYSLSPEAARLITEHTVTVSASGLTLNPCGDNPWWTPVDIPADAIAAVDYTPKAWVITLRHNKLRHITIPRSAVPTSFAPSLDTLLQHLTPTAF